MRLRRLAIWKCGMVGRRLRRRPDLIRVPAYHSREETCGEVVDKLGD
jgi:hypothetical protein